MFARLILAAAFVAAVGSIAFGAPPEGADLNSPIAQWYRSLQRPDVIGGCCDVSDCRPVESRTSDDGQAYEILIDHRWLRVPEEKILHNARNPTGQAVACYMPGLGILCYIPGAGL